MHWVEKEGEEEYKYMYIALCTLCSTGWIEEEEEEEGAAQHIITQRHHRQGDSTTLQLHHTTSPSYIHQQILSPPANI